MKRNKIIKHYKSFFGLEDMGLAENDHLMIDWVESLVKDCNLHIVSNNEVAVCDNCHKNPVLRYDQTTGLDLCSDCYRKAN